MMKVDDVGHLLQFHDDEGNKYDCKVKARIYDPPHNSHQ